MLSYFSGWYNFYDHSTISNQKQFNHSSIFFYFSNYWFSAILVFTNNFTPFKTDSQKAFQKLE